MYLLLLACQARVTVGDSGLWCCVCVMSYPGGVYVPCIYLHARRELQSATEVFFCCACVTSFGR